jgi:hypothetical protein
MKIWNKRVLFFLFAVLLTVKLVLVSCTKDKASAAPVIVPIVLTADCPDTVFYSETIQPLIDQNCTTSSCHDAVSNAGGYNLTMHDQVASNSTIILQSLDPGSGFTPMPFGQAPLSGSQIQSIQCWVDQGKLNN